MKIGYIKKNYYHGIVEEELLNPPKNITYKEIKELPTPADKIISFIPKNNIDLYQSMIYPLHTKEKWVFSLSHLAGSVCFKICNHYLDRKSRISIFKKLIKKDNCKKLIFSSFIAKDTLKTYTNIKDKNILNKAITIYPGIRKFNFKKKKSDKIRLLFVGPDFHRKGGEFVVYAFEKLQKKYDNLQLTIFSNLESKNYKSDYFSKNHDLVLEKIRKNKNIISNSIIPREKLLKNHYPNSDIFLMPTLQDNFGFVLLEAQAFGLPTISTNYFAIPEIIQHNKSGFLINIDKNMTNSIYNNLKKLIENNSLQKKISKNALKNARTKFTFKKRNKIINKIYEEAIK